MAPSIEFPVPTYPSLESLPVDSPLRKLYPEDFYPNGKYFRTPLGRVRYWIIGPSDGPKVAFIHGISTPSVGFSNIAVQLKEAGFQILLYDVYGRGYSEVPKEVVTTNDYLTQLALLLQHVGWSSTYLVGMSMGGSIAAGFTAMFPHLVNGKVVFMAPAGVLDIPVSEQGERVLPPQATSHVQAGAQVEQSDLGGQLRSLQAQHLPGYTKTIQDSMKYGPIAGMHRAYEELASIRTANGPVKPLIIHGTNDAIVPYNNSLKIKKLIPQAELVTVEGAGHHLISEEAHWPTVASNIVKFLSS